MPDICCVGECPSVGTHGGIIRYYTLPEVTKDRGEEMERLSRSCRAAWIASIRMKKPDWDPHESSKVCSFHFVSGKTGLYYSLILSELSRSRQAAWIASIRMKKPQWDPQKGSKVCSFFILFQVRHNHSLIMSVCDAVCQEGKMGSKRGVQGVCSFTFVSSSTESQTYFVCLMSVGLQCWFVCLTSVCFSSISGGSFSHSCCQCWKFFFRSVYFRQYTCNVFSNKVLHLTVGPNLLFSFPFFFSFLFFFRSEIPSFG